MLNRQLIIDTIYPLLEEQGCSSMDPRGQYCQYRGVDNRKCAVGFLIPDENYSEEMDRSNLTAANEKIREAISTEYGEVDLEQGDAIFLNDVQSYMHDSLPEGDRSKFLSELELNTREICERYGLNDPTG